MRWRPLLLNTRSPHRWVFWHSPLGWLF